MFKKLIFLQLISSLFYFNYCYGAEKKTIYEKIDLFSEVLEQIQNEYVDEVDQAELMDSAINGVLQSLDPYSAYMNLETFEDMQTDTKGEFGGLGIEIGMEAGVVKVISPIDGSPAAKVGIKAGDYIVKIDNEQVQGKSLFDAVKLMRGPINTKITLTVRRPGQKKSLEFTITRAIIEVRSVEAKILGEKNNIAYLRLKSFNENSLRQGYHAFLESYLSFEVLKKSLLGWINMVHIFMCLNKKIKTNVFEKFKGDVEEKKSTSTRQSNIELGKRTKTSLAEDQKKLQSDSKV